MERKTKFTKKPWGNFRQFTLNEVSTVKILTVEPHQCLSKQSHRNRDEMWVALDEGAEVELDDKRFKPEKGQEILIPRGTVHRLFAYDTTCRMLEISFGIFDEDDIIRYEDAYGRLESE